MIETLVATWRPQSLAWTPGGVKSGGNRIHFFLPEITAFHADVAFGSLWKLDPDLLGPTISPL